MSLDVRIDIPELEKLRQSFGAHRTVFDAEIKRAETAGLRVLRDEARRRASEFALDARLPKSIRFEAVQGGLAGIVGSLAATGLDIEKGRIDPQISVGHRAALLKSWVARKGLAGTPRSVKTHRMTGRTKAVRAAEIDLAWRIAMAQRGEMQTKRGPLPFIAPAAAAKAEQIKAIFSDAVNRALHKLASL